MGQDNGAGTAQIKKAAVNAQTLIDNARAAGQRAGQESGFTVASDVLIRELSAEVATLRADLRSTCETLARERMEHSAALSVPPLNNGNSLCASTFAGKPAWIEYETDRDACRPMAVWLRGERYDVGEMEIADAQWDAWTRDCEAAELTAANTPDVDAPDWWHDAPAAALAAEDQFIAQRDHAHYARAAA